MSTYHLHARLVEGSPKASVRDEARVSETDSWDDAQAWVTEQLADGFTAWIYDHGHTPAVDGASDFRLVARSQPIWTRAASTRPASTPWRRPSSGTHRIPGGRAF